MAQELKLTNMKVQTRAWGRTLPHEQTYLESRQAQFKKHKHKQLELKKRALKVKLQVLRKSQ